MGEDSELALESPCKSDTSMYSSPHHKGGGVGPSGKGSRGSEIAVGKSLAEPAGGLLASCHGIRPGQYAAVLFDLVLRMLLSCPTRVAGRAHAADPSRGIMNHDSRFRVEIGSC